MQNKIEKHYIKKWEVSIVELENTAGKLYKVTRRFPDLSIAETKFFRNRGEAKALFNQWIN